MKHKDMKAVSKTNTSTFSKIMMAKTKGGGRKTLRGRKLVLLQERAFMLEMIDAVSVL